MNVPFRGVHVGVTRQNVKRERVHVLRPSRNTGVPEGVVREGNKIMAMVEPDLQQGLGGFGHARTCRATQRAMPKIREPFTPNGSGLRVSSPWESFTITVIHVPTLAASQQSVETRSSITCF
jgi:hypothetical protein